jgi:hypothetical protein
VTARGSGATGARGFLVAAAVIGVLYGAANLLGLREETSFLSGTVPPGGAAGTALGLAYVALHFAWVVGAPILVLAAGVRWGMERLPALRAGSGAER